MEIWGQKLQSGGEKQEEIADELIRNLICRCGDQSEFKNTNTQDEWKITKLGHFKL
jgi:hypothetical protein